jgi:hypothetical protein
MVLPRKNGLKQRGVRMRVSQERVMRRNVRVGFQISIYPFYQILIIHQINDSDYFEHIKHALNGPHELTKHSPKNENIGPKKKSPFTYFEQYII